MRCLEKDDSHELDLSSQHVSNVLTIRDRFVYCDGDQGLLSSETEPIGKSWTRVIALLHIENRQLTYRQHEFHHGSNPDYAWKARQIHSTYLECRHPGF